MEISTKPQSAAVLRKRGRPAGRNRVPLTLEERRARNAGYEKERREEIGDALKELRAAAGLGHNLTAHNLLAEVVYFLGNSMQSDHSLEADRIRKCNDNLVSQITMLERCLAEPDPSASLPVWVQQPSEPSYPLKRKAEDCDWNSLPSKRFFPDHYWGGSGQPAESHSHPVWPHRDLQEFSMCPLSSPGPLSPASFYSEALTPLTPETSGLPSPVPEVSCLHSLHPDVNTEQLTETATDWSQAMAIADGPQLSLSQIDYWISEEDLVSLYFSPIV